MSNNTYNFLFKRLDAMQPLVKGLDAYAARQKAIASNIANSETPGYRARRVEFENELRTVVDRHRRMLSRSSGTHIPVAGGQRRMDKLQPHVVENENRELINGVNNVDIDAEMAGMATNQIQFSTAAKVLSMRYKILRSSILGRSSG